MPTPPAVPQVLKVIVGFTVGTDLTARYRTFWQYTGTAPTNTVCDAIATGLITDLVTPFLGYTHPDTIYTSIEVEDLTSPTSGAGSATFSHAGTRAGLPLPAAVAFLLNFKIDRRYRGGKPRIYLPVGADGDVASPQTWAGSFVSNISSQWGVSAGAITGSVYTGTTIGQQVSISLFEGFTSVQNPLTGRWRNVPKYRTGPIPQDLVTSAVGNPKFGSQRRRNLHSA